MADEIGAILWQSMKLSFQHGFHLLSQTTKRQLSVGLMALLLFMGAAHNSNGIAPPFISDKELSEYPVIVVGKWEKAPFEPHNRYRDNVVTAIEAYTKLHVVRVIKGSIQPGVHDLMVGYGVSWSK